MLTERRRKHENKKEGMGRKREGRDLSFIRKGGSFVSRILKAIIRRMATKKRFFVCFCFCFSIFSLSYSGFYFRALLSLSCVYVEYWEC